MASNLQQIQSRLCDCGGRNERLSQGSALQFSEVHEESRGHSGGPVFAFPGYRGYDNHFSASSKKCCGRPPRTKDTPRRLVLWESNPSKGLPETPVAPANFRDRLEDSRSFEDMKLIPPVSPVTVTGRYEHAASNKPRGTMLSADPHWHWKDLNTRTSTKIAGDTPIR